MFWAKLKTVLWRHMILFFSLENKILQNPRILAYKFENFRLSSRGIREVGKGSWKEREVGKF